MFLLRKNSAFGVASQDESSAFRSLLLPSSGSSGEETLPVSLNPLGPWGVRTPWTRDEGRVPAPQPSTAVSAPVPSQERPRP